MSTLLEARGVRKVFQRGPIPVEALRGVDFAIDEGQFLAIMGPSGSGKSSLLHLLGALDELTEGEILFEGKPMAHWGREPEASQFRLRFVGFVFQSFNLVRHLTAEENVALPLILTGCSAADVSARTEALLRRIGLWGRRHHQPHELSGGEQQRVALARAVIHNPRIVLADEPTGNLDSGNSRQVLDLLSEMHLELGTTIAMVTHDPAVAARADSVALILDGRIVDRFVPPAGESEQVKAGAIAARLNAVLRGRSQ